jgi:predicted transcriptional regulator YdeE/DNA-binding transcriptional MerR regulator
MLKIGDFSKLAHVTVKTLRYYAQIGLLRPTWTDRYTGYRYYNLDQLPRLNRILALKDLGFSLQQIAQVLDEDLSAEELRGMVRLRQAELQRQIEQEQIRLAQVEARLVQIEHEGRMPSYDVLLKKIQPQVFASIHTVVPTVAALPEYCHQMAAEVRQWTTARRFQHAGPWTAIYDNLEYTEKNIEIELGVAVDTRVDQPLGGRVGLRILPGLDTLASVIHTGRRNEINEAYTAYYRWAEANDYRLCGPVRELYLDESGEIRLNDCAFTEIQFPTERIPYTSPIDSEQFKTKDHPMEPKFVTLPAFLVAGTRYRGSSANSQAPIEIGHMWETEFMPRIQEIKWAEPGITYGICVIHDQGPISKFDYYACVKVNGPEDVPAGLVMYQVPQQDYAVFEQHGSRQALLDMNAYIYQSWLPKSKYKRAPGPDLEVYDDKFHNFEEDSILYLYVPIVEAKERP